MSPIRRRSTSVLCLALLACAGAALAQPAPAPSPSPSPEPPKVDVGGYVDVYYLYNLNRTDPSLRSYDVLHHAFSLSAADLSLSRTPNAASRVGFVADLFFGKAADLTA